MEQEQEPMTFEDFLKAHEITMECKAGGIPPEEFKDSDSWACKLDFEGRSMEVPFYTGKGLRKLDKPVKPKVEDILDCMASDSAGYDNSRCFEDWAGDYGYDPDSRKGERLYQTIREQRNNLESFLGREDYNDLLYKVERL